MTGQTIEARECPMCGGEGVIPDQDSGGLVDRPCPLCDGEGVVWGDEEELDG